MPQIQELASLLRLGNPGSVTAHPKLALCLTGNDIFMLAASGVISLVSHPTLQDNNLETTGPSEPGITGNEYIITVIALLEQTIESKQLITEIFFFSRSKSLRCTIANFV